MKIVTVSTKSDGYFPVLKKLCKKKNHELIVLGFGEKWKGWVWRTKMFINYISKCDPNEIIMIIDAYDVMVLASHKEIMRKYRNFKCDILFSASCIYSGQPNLSWLYQNIIFNQIKNYFDVPNYKSYILNAGSFMGKASKICELYNRLYKRYIKTLVIDDQKNLNNIRLTGLDYKIDKNSNIFWIWERTSLKELIYFLIYNELYEKTNLYKKGGVQFNNVQPCVVHGIGNRVMDKLCLHLKIPYKTILNLKKKSTVQNDIKIFMIIGKLIIIIVLLVIIKYFI